MNINYSARALRPPPLEASTVGAKASLSLKACHWTGRLDGRLGALDLRRRVYILIGNSDLGACLVVSRADFGPIGLNQGRIGTK